MHKKRVLFVCVHNSARSQMAEAFLKKYGNDCFEVESAGLEPGMLNPLAIKVMKEVGIDISQNKTKSAFDFYKQEKQYDYVIAVCSQSEGKACPVFPGKSRKLYWNFDDPSSFAGTQQERLQKTREVRDRILETIQEWMKNFKT